MRNPTKCLLAGALFSFLFFGQCRAQYVGFGASPELSYRNLVKTDFVPGIDDFIDDDNEVSEASFGYTVGAYFLKPFGRKLSFETGVSLSQDGYNQVYKDLDYNGLIESGFIDSDDPGYEATEEIEIRNRFHSVGIPFRLVYLADGEKVRFTWGLGITPEYIFYSSTQTVYRFDFGEEERFDGEFETAPADFNLTASLSAGVEVALDRGHGQFVRIEPVVRYGIFPVFDESAYEVNLFSYGLSLKYFFTTHFR